jgi:hypothetical protein
MEARRARAASSLVRSAGPAAAAEALARASFAAYHASLSARSIGGKRWPKTTATTYEM